MRISALFMIGVSIACAAANPLCGQSFQNLDFEAAQIIPVSTNGSGSVNITAANALPGWTAFAGTSELSLIAYNTPGSVVAPPVGLDGTPEPAIQGNFQVALTGSGSISQTGLVPAGSESLRFDEALGGSLPFIVSLDGQDLSYSPIAEEVTASGLQYTVYGADVSAFAGQEETLTFSADTGHAGGGVLDDIQFSDLPVPEPGELALAVSGAALFAACRRRLRL